jgi:hypothetical protein
MNSGKSVKKAVGTLLVFVALSLTAFAQDLHLSPGDLKPVADGVIGANEYSSMTTIGPVTVYASLDRDGVLYLAASSTMKGWVALGLGSEKMDGSTIFMGFVKDGKSQFSIQTGKGHGHFDAKGATTLSQGVSLSDGGTILEFSVPLDSFLKSGSDTVGLIVGASDATDFATRHSFRASSSISVSK